MLASSLRVGGACSSSRKHLQIPAARPHVDLDSLQELNLNYGLSEAVLKQADSPSIAHANHTGAPPILSSQSCVVAFLVPARRFRYAGHGAGGSGSEADVKQSSGGRWRLLLVRQDLYDMHLEERFSLRAGHIG